MLPSPPLEMPNCSAEDVSRCWDRNEGQWSGFVRDDLDIHRLLLHGPALLDACRDVNGLRALDLGCGEGWCSRELARRGALVTGVDVSQKQIAAASAYPVEAPGRVDYLVMDAANVDRHPWPAPFDIATACMSLQDMCDPAGVLRATARVLAPGGRLICSCPHPFTNMLGGRQYGRREGDGRLWLAVGGYFNRGARPHQVRWNLPRAKGSWTTIRWSRSLEEYWRLFADAGFTVRELMEPAPDGDEVRQRLLGDSKEIPKYLVVVAEPNR